MRESPGFSYSQTIKRPRLLDPPEVSHQAIRLRELLHSLASYANPCPTRFSMRLSTNAHVLLIPLALRRGIAAGCP
jgi:hypothetical protein